MQQDSEQSSRGGKDKESEIREEKEKRASPGKLTGEKKTSWTRRGTTAVKTLLRAKKKKRETKKNNRSRKRNGGILRRTSEKAGEGNYKGFKRRENPFIGNIEDGKRVFNRRSKNSTINIGLSYN